MQYYVLSLLLIPLLTQALILYNRGCISIECKENIIDYLEELNPSFQSKKEGDGYLITITQSIPTEDITYLYIIVYNLCGSSQHAIDLTTDIVGNNFEIYIPLSERNINDYNCPYVTVSPLYINRECIFHITFDSHGFNYIRKDYSYRVLMRIPRVTGQHYYVHGSLQFSLRPSEHCMCQRVINYQYDAKLYKGGSCQEEITSEANVIYGDYICIGVFDKRLTIPFKRPDIVGLETTYTLKFFRSRTFNMLDLAIIKDRLDEIVTERQIYVIFPLTYVGRLEINMLIMPNYVLDSGLCNLSKGIRLGFRTLRVIDPDGLFPGDDEENSAGSIVVSLITLLCLLVTL